MLIPMHKAHSLNQTTRNLLEATRRHYKGNSRSLGQSIMPQSMSAMQHSIDGELIAAQRIIDWTTSQS